MTKTKVALIFLFIVLSLLFWSLRLYRLEELTTFHLDQAIYFNDVKQMVDSRTIRLIGPIVSTRLVEGISYFNGPHYYYILAALGVIFNWDAVKIVTAVLFYWWAGALVMLYWVGKKIGWLEGLLIYGLMVLSPLFVQWSRLLNNPNFLPLISIGFFYFIFKSVSSNKKINWFLSGVCLGLGLSFHYSILIWVGILFASLATRPLLSAFGKSLKFITSKLTLSRKIGSLKSETITAFISSVIALLGLFIGNLPFFIFEFRHSFYNTRTFIKLGADPNGSGLYSDYLPFGFIPLIFIPIALITRWVNRRIGFLPTFCLVLLVLVFVGLKNDLHPVRGVGMPRGWSVPKMKYIADKICRDKGKGKFQVITMITSDVRGTDLRWWIERRCGEKALDYSNYREAKTLYLIDYGDLAKGNENNTWEYSSFGGSLSRTEEKLGELTFYRLQK